MQRLRQTVSIARFVLAWFALALGVAIASPLVKPQSIELICSGSGAMKLLVKSSDGSAPAHGHTLDCPLCVTLDAPPAVASLHIPPAQPLGHATPSIPAARVVALSAAPLPARGPPFLLLS